jgi:hypothetical protein
MALPIAATPTLEGENLRRFYKELDENENKKAPRKEVLRSIAVFNEVMKKNPNIGMFTYNA